MAHEHGEKSDIYPRLTSVVRLIKDTVEFLRVWKLHFRKAPTKYWFIKDILLLHFISIND